MLTDIYTLAVTAVEADTTNGGPLTQIVQKFGVDWRILIAQIINFGIVALLLWKFAFKRVLVTVEERQNKIADGLQYAEEMKHQLAEAERHKAATLKEASQDAAKTLETARRQAKNLLEKETAQTALKIEKMTQKAKEALAAEREHMRTQVRQEVTRLVVKTTAIVLSKKLSDDEKAAFSETAAQELAAQI